MSPHDTLKADFEALRAALGFYACDCDFGHCEITNSPRIDSFEVCCGFVARQALQNVQGLPHPVTDPDPPSTDA